MSWVTVVYAMLIGASAAIALPNLLVGIWQRRAAQLFFVGVVIGTIGLAAGELAMMYATSAEGYARALRWVHVPIFVGFVSIVGFVQLYFGTGRLWMGLLVCGLRFLCLIINFISPLNLNFRAIIGLSHIPLLGEMVSTARGLVSSWNYLSHLTSLLLIVFVADASISLWRKGEPRDRRRALSVGGSIVFFLTLSAMSTALFYLKIFPAPYLLSVWFFAIVSAMSFELGYDLFVAGQVAQELQASEASLLESETRFGRMADAAPVMIWMAGPDKLCTYFNKAWLDFTGRTMEQELGNGWSQGVHPDDFERCLKTYVERFDARESFFMQYRLRRRDGEYRYVTDTGVPRYGSKGRFRGYIGACQDITDLLEKERALRDFEQRVTLAAEAAHLGVWELDTTTKDVWLSDSARVLFGFEPLTNVSYGMFLNCVHPEDRAQRDSLLQKAIETQGGYETEYRVLLPDGTVRWISGRARHVSDESGKLTRLLGVSMDVTERKQAQELFRVATEASPSGMLLVNEQGRIVLVNAHVEKLFGYQRDELVGKLIETLVPQRFASGHPAHRTNFFANPEPRALGVGRDLSARRKDGSEFPVEVAVNPIRTPEGILVLATVIDVTERKLAEEQARNSRDEINRLSRISLLGEMTASIAHELGQPLSGISNNASAGQRFIDRGTIDIATLREILVDIEAEAHRANEVIRNIRNTVKKGAALREPINLNDLIMRVGHILQPDARAHSCELNISLPNDLPSVQGDPVQIQQVLVNLVINAFEAMLDTPLGKRKVEIAAERNGDGMVCVSVLDQGVGVSDETRGRIFDQFFTTKEEGLGMGLAIVRSAIEAHGGKIEVENLDGAGARFFFTLPIQFPSS